MTFKPIATQEEFDEAIKDRIKRAEEGVRAQYSDYEDVKKRLEEFEHAADAKKSDLEKALEDIKSLKDEKAARDQADKVAAMRKKVAKETGVPEDLVQGTDEESMTAFAKAVSAYAKKPAAPDVGAAGRAPTGASSDAVDKSEMSDFVRQLFGED